jgi:regulatory protein
MPIQPLSLKARALRLLGMREHSRAELAQKLARHVQEGEDLEAVLDWLAAKDFLNEARAAEAIVHRQAARHGSARVKQTLRQKGVPDELIEASMAGLQDTEQARALAVWQRKFGTLPDSPQARAKQMRFMASRGFGGGVLDGIWRAEREARADAHTEDRESE